MILRKRFFLGRVFLTFLFVLAAAVPTSAQEGDGGLLAEMTVLSADGTPVAVPQLKAGDVLLSYDPEKGLATTTVQQVIRKHVDSYFVLKAGAIALHGTGGLLLSQGKEKPLVLDSLQYGAPVFVLEGKKLKQKKIDSLRSYPATLLAYTILLTGPHWFFSSGILLHD